MRMGLFLLLFALIFLALFGALCYTLYREYSVGGMQDTRFAAFLVVIALQLPFILLFASGARKLLAALPILKQKIAFRR